MNKDILTVALTEQECSLFKYLLSAEEPDEIHEIVTSIATSKDKTLAILKKMDEFRVLFGALTWNRQTDNFRAYRQLSPAAVLRLREILLNADATRMDTNSAAAYQKLAPIAMESITRAINTRQDKPVIPVRMENPRAKA